MEVSISSRRISNVSSHSGPPADAERPALQPTKTHGLCPEGECLAHVGSSHESAVDHHVDLRTYCFDNMGQDLDRPNGVV
jgi:hypothetical protein